MATIGHPLSDICNLLIAFWGATAASRPSCDDQASLYWADTRFRPGTTPGLPPREQLLAWYAAESSPGRHAPTLGEMAWGMAFVAFRTAAICQGIAARAAVRQASSAQAAGYAQGRGPLAKFAWELAREGGGRSRL